MEPENGRLFLLTGKITVYLGLMVATFATFLYLQFYNPQLLKELIITVDVVGVTPIGQAEQARIATINTLPITYEEKQVLINHTVFLGANTQMVMLALGNPKESRAGSKPASSVLVYYESDDPRPTILRFEQDKLIHAYKGSALDLAATP